METNEFVASSLKSQQLLALLYVLECERKGIAVDTSDGSPWKEFLDTFESRLCNLSESGRFEVLEAHLMSVEDIDVYDNEGLSKLLETSKDHLKDLGDKLTVDGRFA